MSQELLSGFLRVGSLFLASANVIVAFSLLAYIASHNLRSPVAQAFCALLSFVLVVFAGDVILSSVDTLRAAALWLRMQWLGIAFVPAAYLHFSHALLRTTGVASRWRRAIVVAGYALGAVFFFLAILTDWVVYDGLQTSTLFHLRAGPLFWAFAIYYVVATIWGLLNVRWARSRCLTSASRRRMDYLALAFAAPGLGVFPYLLVATMSQHLSINAVLGISLVGNMAVALMTVAMGYIVAYQGAILPDRLIKHNMVHYLLRGPVVAAVMIVLILVIPSVERIIGIKRDTVLIFAIVIASVLFQVFISLAKPYIDRLIYRQDRDQVAWIQELDKRLLTTSDMEQILENVLVALCDLMRVRSGFIVTMSGNALHLQVFCGPREPAVAFLRRTEAHDLVAGLQSSRRRPGAVLSADDFVARNGHALLPLRSRDGETTLGILGIERWAHLVDLTPSELGPISALVHRAELALDDMRLQQEVFEVLRRMEPEIAQLQRWGSTPHYAQNVRLEALESSPIHSPELRSMVRDALSHYWGGPKLSKSPLLRLAVVQKALPAHDNVPAKALRAVLHDAIERLRPASQRSLIASEWTVYNILDLRYIRGEHIREVASRLAMSESDFYRKQRVAIDEVAKALCAMEKEALS